MNFGVTEILFAIVAAVVAYLGFTTGRKIERPKALEEGRQQGAREVAIKTTEHTLEKVNEANAAAATVERRDPAGVRDAARADPNNLGRVQRP